MVVFPLREFSEEGREETARRASSGRPGGVESDQAQIVQRFTSLLQSRERSSNMDFKIAVEGLKLEGAFAIADLEAVLEFVRRSRRAVGLYFRVLKTGGLPILGVNMFLLSVDNPGQGFSFTAVDDKGNPATVENVKYTVSDPTLLTLQVSGDGLTATVVAVGPLGTSQLNVTCNPTGDTAHPLSGTLAIQTVAGEAATITLTPVVVAPPVVPPVSPAP